MYRSPLGPILLGSVIARGLSLLDIDLGSDASWIRVRIVNRMARSGRTKGVKPFFLSFVAHYLPIDRAFSWNPNSRRSCPPSAVAPAVILANQGHRPSRLQPLFPFSGWHLGNGLEHSRKQLRSCPLRSAAVDAAPASFPGHSSELDENGFGPLDSSSPDLLRPPLGGGDFQICGSPRLDLHSNRSDLPSAAPVANDKVTDGLLSGEKKIEHIFECHNYSELKKVKLAAIEFTDYALIWLDQLTASRRRNGERPISTWNEMKAVMRRRFIPTHYHRELFNKLQNLTQGNRSVEDYYKEMEVAMIRANIDEDREATMARFLAGLDPNIAAIVELQHYVEIEDMVHMAMKVERQLKKKGTTRAYGGSTTKWGQGPYKPKPTFSPNEKGGPSRNVKPIAETNKGKGTTMPARSRDVQCFKCLGRGHIASQCPNRNTMLLRDDGEVESEQEEEENENDAIQEEEELEHAVEGEALIVKRSLSMQPMEGDEQHENIFHTRCHIGGKVCFVIIDGGSCTNVASTLMVEKLGLATTKHPHPYKLQWLNDGGELKVSKQVLIVFSIGKYKDEVLCDVVPMHAGRPWQFDRRVVHDGYTNRYTFTHKARKITLAPLSPTQVQKDQIHLRNSFERAKEREAKIEVKANESDQDGGKKISILSKERELRKCLLTEREALVLMSTEESDECLGNGHFPFSKTPSQALVV
ncbi:hypothetical protein GQ457_14G014350 [Hibiscus cannabinus]